MIRTLWILLGLVLSANPAFSSEKLKSMKGWDLFSWKDQNSQMHYTLVRGTNYQKSAREILSAEGGDLSALKVKLGKLAPREEILWNHFSGIDWMRGGDVLKMALPPTQTTKSLIAFCKKNGLKIQIDK